MALILCPECGNRISDKAGVCPHCGHITSIVPQAVEAKQKTGLQEQSGAGVSQGNSSNANSPISPAPKKKHKKLLAVLAIILAAGIVFSAGAFVLIKLVFNSNTVLSVESIELKKWECTDVNSYYSTYKATVTSDTKAPFVAVIGYYNSSDTDKEPFYVYMEDGVGTLKKSVSNDDDPSLLYLPIGYLTGIRISENDFSKIQTKASDYHDYEYLGHDTSCDLEINAELKSSLSGLVVVSISNDLTKDVNDNVLIPVVSGHLEYNTVLSELPFKSRGVEATITPKFFIPCDPITEDDYEIDQELKLEKDSSSYSTSYSGSEILRFKEFENGLLIYTKTLESGGAKDDREKPKNTTAFLHKGKAEIYFYTFDSESNHKSMIKPVFSYVLAGYIPFQLLYNTL